MKCIYQIFCIDPDINEIYIGSTDNFNKRKIEHKTKYNGGCPYKVYNFISEHGILSNWDITPIEIIDFPISDLELRQYEQGYLDKYKPQLNCRRAYSSAEDTKETNKQYYQDNKEQKKEYQIKNKEKISIQSKEYREKNKDKIKAKVKCPHCNKEMRKDSITRHIRKYCPST